MHAGKTERKDQCYLQPTHIITIVSALSFFSIVLTLSPSSSPSYIHTGTHHIYSLSSSFVRMTKKKEGRESRDSRFIVVVVACSLSTVDIDFRTSSFHEFVSTLVLSLSSLSSPSLVVWCRRLPSILLYRPLQIHHFHRFQQLRFNRFHWYPIEWNLDLYHYRVWHYRIHLPLPCQLECYRKRIAHFSNDLIPVLRRQARQHLNQQIQCIHQQNLNLVFVDDLPFVEVFVVPVRIKEEIIMMMEQGRFDFISS